MDLGFGNWVTIHAQRYPERTAFIDGESGAGTTFGELEKRTNALADSLRIHGVRRGDRVAMMTLNSVPMMEVYLAVAKLGAISVPINFRLTAPEVEYILRDSGSSVVFVSPIFEQTMEVARADIPAVRERFLVPMSRQRAAGGLLDYGRLLSRGNNERVMRDVSHDDVCVLMYTSGTTGFPKGAMLTHGNFQWNAIHALALGAGTGRDDITVSSAPLFHIGALGVHTLPFLYIGARSIIQEAFTPESWLDLVERYRVTQAFLIPSMWGAVAKSPTIGSRDLDSLRFAVSGGAPCPIPVIEAMQQLGVQFTEGFGMTETSPNAAVLMPEDVVGRAGSIGKPLTHMEFRVADEDDRDVIGDEVGELLVRGPNVFVGYWDKPEATSEALRGGWFHTGDMARIDGDGYVTLVDRKKDMIITGGENVYPIEVEQVIYRHPDVDEVAVIGVPDDTWGETIIACVVKHDGSDLTDTELVAWTREKVAHFKAPRRVEFVDELPRNATGKILKRELRKQHTGSTSQVSR